MLQPPASIDVLVVLLQWQTREDGKDHDTIKPLASLVRGWSCLMALLCLGLEDRALKKRPLLPPSVQLPCWGHNTALAPSDTHPAWCPLHPTAIATHIHKQGFDLARTVLVDNDDYKAADGEHENMLHVPHWEQTPGGASMCWICRVQLCFAILLSGPAIISRFSCPSAA